MRQYETMVIIDAMIAEAAIEQEVSSIEAKIAAKGELVWKDVWGKRKMAYDISKKSHGFYVVFYYKATTEIVVDLEKDFVINENILRWMTLNDAPIPVEIKAQINGEPVPVRPELVIRDDQDEED